MATKLRMISVGQKTREEIMKIPRSKQIEALCMNRSKVEPIEHSLFRGRSRPSTPSDNLEIGRRRN